MPQFDVYANPSASTKRMYPYLLDIQSDPPLRCLSLASPCHVGENLFWKGKADLPTPTVAFVGEE